MRAPAHPSRVAALALTPSSTARPCAWLCYACVRLARGLRVSGYWGAHLLDQAEHAVSELARQRARRLAGLLTPVIKAFSLNRAFTWPVRCCRFSGGDGYICEYAIEQTLRDSRTTMIYEGSDEMQANDLLLRKVLADQGVAFAELLALFDEECASGGAYPGLLVGLCSKLHRP